MRTKLTKKQKKNRAAEIVKLSNKRRDQSPELRRQANVKATLSRHMEIRKRILKKAELEAAKKAGKTVEPAPLPLEQLVQEIANKL